MKKFKQQDLPPLMQNATKATQQRLSSMMLLQSSSMPQAHLCTSAGVLHHLYM